MTDYVVMTVKDMRAIADAFVARPDKMSKSGALNLLTRTLMGPNHDFGRITHGDDEYLYSQRGAAKLSNNEDERPETLADILGLYDKPAEKPAPMLYFPRLKFDRTKLVTINQEPQSRELEKRFARDVRAAGFEPVFKDLEQLNPHEIKDLPFASVTGSNIQEIQNPQLDPGQYTLTVFTGIENQTRLFLGEFTKYLARIINNPHCERRVVLLSKDRQAFVDTLRNYAPEILDLVENDIDNDAHYSERYSEPRIFAANALHTMPTNVLLGTNSQARATYDIQLEAQKRDVETRVLDLKGVPDTALLEDISAMKPVMDKRWTPKSNRKHVTVYRDVDALSDRALTALLMHVTKRRLLVPKCSVILMSTNAARLRARIDFAFMKRLVSVEV